MEITLSNIVQDPLLLTMIAVGIVLVLSVVLVVVIAAMRVRTYKNLYRNTHFDNKKKEAQILSLQENVQEIEAQNTEYQETLAAYNVTKKALQAHQEELTTVREEKVRVQERYTALQSELNDCKERYDAIAEELKLFKERVESITDENNKLRVNNARLLMKLETEERYQTMRKSKE